MYMYILKNNSKVHTCVPKQLKRQICNNKFLDPLGFLLIVITLPSLSKWCACYSLAFLYGFTTYLFISISRKLCKLPINFFMTYFLNTLYLPHIFRLSIFLNCGTVTDFERCSAPRNGQFFLQRLVLEGFLPKTPSPNFSASPVMFTDNTQHHLSVPMPHCVVPTLAELFSREFPQSHLIPYALYPV